MSYSRCGQHEGEPYEFDFAGEAFLSPVEPMLAILSTLMESACQLLTVFSATCHLAQPESFKIDMVLKMRRLKSPDLLTYPYVGMF